MANWRLFHVYFQLIFAGSPTKPINNLTPTLRNLDSQFVGVLRRLGFCKSASRIGPNSIGSKIICWFKFGIYGSQSRDDFDRVDVEQFGVAEGLRSLFKSLSGRENCFSSGFLLHETIEISSLPHGLNYGRQMPFKTNLPSNIQFQLNAMWHLYRQTY
ncbi:hypothetical protein R6Q57_021820 [Mikania cordata]